MDRYGIVYQCRLENVSGFVLDISESKNFIFYFYVTSVCFPWQAVYASFLSGYQCSVHVHSLMRPFGFTH